MLILLITSSSYQNENITLRHLPIKVKNKHTYNPQAAFSGLEFSKIVCQYLRSDMGERRRGVKRITIVLYCIVLYCNLFIAENNVQIKVYLTQRANLN